jgi:MtfA peptidase
MWLQGFSDYATLVFIIFIAIRSTQYFFKFFTDSDEEDAKPQANISSIVSLNHTAPTRLVYHGNALAFSDQLLREILQRRFNYYNGLTTADQAKFIRRLKNFIDDKTFTIHDKKGFREMPVLISSCAIQLTFGLDKYLLPFFKNIHIYPAEFLGIYPTIRYLMGNVTGDTINIGWKYFMEGIEDSTDGKNVGLHEMSHALYYQTFVVEDNVDKDFKKTFDQFTLVGDQVYSSNKEERIGLYSPYALNSFQEFWAESVELFFEKPAGMKSTYPELYSAMADLLEQDPLL